LVENPTKNASEISQIGSGSTNAKPSSAAEVLSVLRITTLRIPKSAINLASSGPEMLAPMVWAPKAIPAIA
jgi:hypothetical protein